MIYNLSIKFAVDCNKWNIDSAYGAGEGPEVSPILVSFWRELSGTEWGVCYE